MAPIGRQASHPARNRINDQPCGFKPSVSKGKHEDLRHSQHRQTVNTRQIYWFADVLISRYNHGCAAWELDVANAITFIKFIKFIARRSVSLSVLSIKKERAASSAYCPSLVQLVHVGSRPSATHMSLSVWREHVRQCAAMNKILKGIMQYRATIRGTMVQQFKDVKDDPHVSKYLPVIALCTDNLHREMQNIAVTERPSDEVECTRYRLI